MHSSLAELHCIQPLDRGVNLSRPTGWSREPLLQVQIPLRGTVPFDWTKTARRERRPYRMVQNWRGLFSRDHVELKVLGSGQSEEEVSSQLLSEPSDVSVGTFKFPLS